jgi:hypothetical protein
LGQVDGVDGGDFPPADAANQPLRMWKKGSASAAASEFYAPAVVEDLISLFYMFDKNATPFNS